ncbi:hypothetical protein ACFQ07_23230 [Actinomadura adrarensis]|uniref:Uncharacterized protein n=1 Tax=Actinomadura adrarensis TaxID=1819600 RepID=A0ABW3CKT7_9ACTN
MSEGDEVLSTSLEPLAVYDVRDDGWYDLPDGQREALGNWLLSQGEDPEGTYRAEIYDGFMRVFRYGLDEDGHKLVAPGGREAVRLEPFDVPISGMPPLAPWTDT